MDENGMLVATCGGLGLVVWLVVGFENGMSELLTSICFQVSIQEL